MGFSIFFYYSDFSFSKQTSLSLSSSSFLLSAIQLGIERFKRGGGGHFDLDAKGHSPSSLHFLQSNKMKHHPTAIPQLLIGKWDGWRERGKRGRMEFHVFGRRKLFAKGCKRRKQFQDSPGTAKRNSTSFLFPYTPEKIFLPDVTRPL